MTWQNEIVRMVRFLVNDIDASTYDDSRLEETILVAAQLLIGNIDFDRTYTVDVDTLVLSPDPTTLTTKDNNFINLLAVQASCIILGISNDKELTKLSNKLGYFIPPKIVNDTDSRTTEKLKESLGNKYKGLKYFSRNELLFLSQRGIYELPSSEGLGYWHFLVDWQGFRL